MQSHHPEFSTSQFSSSKKGVLAQRWKHAKWEARPLKAAHLPWFYDRSGNNTATMSYSRILFDACLNGVRVLMMDAVGWESVKWWRGKSDAKKQQAGPLPSRLWRISFGSFVVNYRINLIFFSLDPNACQADQPPGGRSLSSLRSILVETKLFHQ
jgi:hypothetical protein